MEVEDVQAAAFLLRCAQVLRGYGPPGTVIVLAILLVFSLTRSMVLAGQNLTLAGAIAGITGQIVLLAIVGLVFFKWPL